MRKNKKQTIVISYADILEKIAIKEIIDPHLIISETDHHYYQYYALNAPFDLIYLHTGIAYLNTLINVNEIVNRYNVKHFINYGSCGAFNLNVFDIVLPVEFKLLSHSAKYLTLNKNFKNNALKHLNLPRAIIGTSVDFIRELKELKVDVVDMEVFNVIYFCSLKNIPFYSLKYVSDIIGKNSNLKVVNENIKKGAKLVAPYLKQLFNKFNSLSN